VAIGSNAGTNRTGYGAISIGYSAATSNDSAYAVNIGWEAGTSGGISSAGSNSVSIGYRANYGGATLYANTLVLNASGTGLTPAGSDRFYVKPIRRVTGSVPSGFSPMYYNTSTGEIIVVG
jgi:hypothetical protein